MKQGLLVLLMGLLFNFLGQSVQAQVGTPKLFKATRVGPTSAILKCEISNAEVGKDASLYTSVFRYYKEISIYKYTSEGKLKWEKLIKGMSNIHSINSKINLNLNEDDSVLLVIFNTESSFTYDSLGRSVTRYAIKKSSSHNYKTMCNIVAYDLNGNFKYCKRFEGWSQNVQNIGSNISLVHTTDTFSEVVLMIDPTNGSIKHKTSAYIRTSTQKRNYYNISFSNKISNKSTNYSYYSTYVPNYSDSLIFRNDTLIKTDSTYYSNNRGIFKLDSMGKFIKYFSVDEIWKLDSNGYFSTDIAVDKDDNIYILYNLTDTVNIAINGGKEYIKSVGNKTTAALVKYNPEGKIINKVVFNDHSKKIRSISRVQNSMCFVEDTLLKIEFFAHKDNDLNPSDKDSAFINTKGADSLGIALVFLDTALNYKGNLNLRTTDRKQPYYWNNFSATEIAFLPNQKMFLSTTSLYNHKLDLDFSSSTNWYHLRKDSVLHAFYHTEKLGKIGSISGPKTICLSNDSIFTFSVSKVKNAQAYKWYLPDGSVIVGAKNENTVQVKFTKPFVYVEMSVTAFRINDSVQSPINYISMQQANAKLSFVYGDKRFCLGDSVMTETSYKGQSYYHWVNNTLIDSSNLTSQFRVDSLNHGDTLQTRIKLANTCMYVTDKVVFQVDTPESSRLVFLNRFCELKPLLLRMFDADTFSIYQNNKLVFKNSPRNFNVNNVKTGDSIWWFATDKYGCSIKGDTSVLNLIPAPKAELKADTTICEDVPIQLEAKNGKYYEWSIPGFKNGDAIIPSKSNNIYTVKVTGYNNCMGYDTIEVNVISKPVLSLNRDTILCENDELQLTASGAVSYVWEDTIANNSVIQARNSQYYVVSGRGSNTCVTKDSFKLEVLPLADLELKQNLLVCKDSYVHLKAKNASEYYWSNSITNGDSVQIKNAIEYSIRAIAKNGCVTNDTVQIKVYQNPIYQSTKDTLLCMGENLRLWTKGPYQFNWIGVKGNDVLVNPKADKDYILTAIDTVNFCKIIDTINVQVDEVPTLKILSDSIVCENENVLLNAKGAHIYKWSNGIENNTNFKATITSKLWVEGKLNNSSCLAYDTLNLKVLPSPKPSLQQFTSLTDTQKITFYAGSFTSYKWSNQSTDSIFIFDGSKEQLGDHIVWVEVEAENACLNSDTSAFKLISSTAIHSIDDGKIAVYPNPAHDVIYVQSEIEFTNYELYNSQGKQVLLGQFKTQIGLQKLSSGIYLLKLNRQNGQSYYTKISVK